MGPFIAESVAAPATGSRELAAHGEADRNAAAEDTPAAHPRAERRRASRRSAARSRPTASISILQPIVTLPQRKVRYYEAMSRLRTETRRRAARPADFIADAEAGGLMPKIDNLVAFRCVQVVRRLLLKNRDIGLFCNLSSPTLSDSRLFPAASWSSSTPTARSRRRSCWNSRRAACARWARSSTRASRRCAERGFRFSMDNVIDLRIEPRDLADRNFRFIKVPASFLLDRRHRASPTSTPADLSDLVGRFGIDLIADKIESEGSVVDLLDCDVRYGQGFLFSPPRPVRAEALPADEAPNESRAHRPRPAGARRHHPWMTAPVQPLPPIQTELSPMSASPALTSHFAPLSEHYDVVLSDVWGVVHNGVLATPEACDALARFRQQGGTVVLITNAPRPGEVVMHTMLDRLKVPRTAYDGIVSSGDVTRALIAARGRPARAAHRTTARPADLRRSRRAGRRRSRTPTTSVCSGLTDDTVETPDDYRHLIAQMRERNLPMICANPDIVVERGDTLVYCAGAIADLYADAGGDVIYAGKPYPPIYEQALAIAQGARGAAADRKRVLAIGDSVRTDLKGAVAFGIDCLFVTAGIHADELGERDNPDAAAVGDIFAKAGVYPKAVMRRLAW